nr:hypothetical protein [Treponemataceae bacterium]
MNNIINRLQIIDQKLTSQNVIKNGTSVYVRVIGQSQNSGKYIVSFMGNKFEVASKIPLESGQEFKAKFQIEKNLIQLIPQIEEKAGIINEGSIKKLTSKDLKENESLRNLLENLGLEADETSLKLLQFMIQNNKKVNAQAIRRARIAGKMAARKNHKLSQEKLSELDLALLLKELDDSDENLLSLYYASYGINNANEEKQSKSKE